MAPIKEFYFRKSLDPEMTENMIICHDYWIKRDYPERFNLCPECPRPLSHVANYKLNCQKHNKPTKFFYLHSHSFITFNETVRQVRLADKRKCPVCSLGELRGMEDFYNVRLNSTDGEEFLAHKLSLVIRSSYLTSKIKKKLQKQEQHQPQGELRVRVLEEE